MIELFVVALLCCQSFLLGEETAAAPEPGQAQGSAPKQKNRLDDLKADQMHFKVEDSTGMTVIVLDGHVRVVTTQFRLRADYAQGRQAKDGLFDVAFAKGNVQVFAEGLMLQGDRLDFDVETQKILLTSEEGRPNPRAWREGRVISAKQIIYDLRATEEGRKILFQGDARMVEEAVPEVYYEEFPKKDISNGTPNPQSKPDTPAPKK